MITWLPFPFQSKIHAARSLSEIAIDLTETGTLKTSKLANMGSKGKIISGSSGSLLSSGKAGLWHQGAVAGSVEAAPPSTAPTPAWLRARSGSGSH